MLSLFPHLLDFALLAPTLLRFVAGLIFIDLGYLMLTTEKKSWGMLLRAIGLGTENFWRRILGYVQIISGSLLIIGLYTQGAALVLGILIFIELMIEYREPSFIKRDLSFYILLFTITVSLLFLGAGSFAFDLPL